MKTNKEIAKEITDDPKLAAEIEKALKEVEDRNTVLRLMFNEKTAPEPCGPQCVVAEHYKYMSSTESNESECHCLDGLSEFNTRKLKHALQYYRRELKSAQNSASEAAWANESARYR